MLRARLAPFAASERGIAATEFALILPVMLMIYFGVVEICNMMGASRKIDLLSRTVGDLVGGVSAPTRAQIDDIFQSSRITLAPFDGAGLEMVVSAVGVFGALPSGLPGALPGSLPTGGQMRVCSSVAAAGLTPRPAGDVPAIPLPEALNADGARLLLVEVRMPYKPLAGDAFAGLFGQSLSGVAFSRQLFWPVRFGRRYASQSPEIVLPSGSACPAR